MAQGAQRAQTETLDPRVTSVLRSGESFEVYRQALMDAGIEDPNEAALALQVLRLAKETISASEFLKGIQERFELSPELARQVAVAVGEGVLVSQDYGLPFPVKEHIAFWKGEAEQEVLDPFKYVHEYVSSQSGALDEHFARRLESILRLYVFEQLSRDQAKERLMGSPKLDGLGLSDEAAEQALTAFDEDRSQKRVGGVSAAPQEEELPETEKESVVDALGPEVPPEPAIVANPPITQIIEPEKKPIQVEPDFSKEEQEAQKIKEEKAHIIEEQGPLDVAGVVKEVCQNPVFQLEDEMLQGRCEKIVESRVRDVRDAFAARSALEKPVDQGGVGVSGRRLADMVQALETLVQKYQTTLEEQHAKEREAATLQEPSREELAKKEEDLLSKRYAELTGKMPQERVAPVAPPIARTSAAISAHHEQLQREGKIDTEKVKQIVQQSKTPSAKSGSPSRPSMQEVTFQKRLHGPTEELKTLSLIDFRRLSKDPMQAATKVKDKVDLLEDQGYEKKVEAIQAWRSSPMNQMYVSMTQDAVLKGVPLQEILSQKRQAGEEIFTDEELKAVMKLNADLRF